MLNSRKVRYSVSSVRTDKVHRQNLMIFMWINWICAKDFLPVQHLTGFLFND